MQTCTNDVPEHRWLSVCGQSVKPTPCRGHAEVIVHFEQLRRFLTSEGSGDDNGSWVKTTEDCDPKLQSDMHSVSWIRNVSKDNGKVTWRLVTRRRYHSCHYCPVLFENKVLIKHIPGKQQPIIRFSGPTNFGTVPNFGEDWIFAAPPITSPSVFANFRSGFCPVRVSGMINRYEN